MTSKKKSVIIYLIVKISVLCNDIAQHRWFIFEGKAMKMKKALFLVLFVVILSALFVSCNKISCMEPFNNHKIVIDEAVDPTCSATGLTEGQHCSECNKVLVAQSIIPSIPHTEVIDKAVAPTCTKTGYTEGKHCSECDMVFVAQEEVPMIPHKEVVQAAVEATCTKTGYTEGKYCADCNKVLVTRDVVPMKEHNKVIVPAVDSTCTSVGLTEGAFCLDCKEILVDYHVIPMKDHVEGDWIIDKEATAHEPGKKHQVCANCGSTIKEEIIPQLQ